MSATWIVNKRQVLCAVVESDMQQKTMTTIINMIILCDCVCINHPFMGCRLSQKSIL